MATVVLPPAVGAGRTIPMGLSRRTASRISMMVKRFALWHDVEPRADVWASVGALAFAGVATLVLVWV